MEIAIDYIKGKMDSISQDIACKLHEMKDMPENEKAYNMALLQPFIDLHAELEALIKFCELAKTSNNVSALHIPAVINQRELLLAYQQFVDKSPEENMNRNIGGLVDEFLATNSL